MKIRRTFKEKLRGYEDRMERERSEKEEAMNLCSGSRFDSHDEVAYEGNTCPVCQVREELRSELLEQDGEIKQLEKEIAQLEAR